MITLNQTPNADNKVIWFFKCTFNDGTNLLLTDNTNGITLTKFYDGNSLVQESNIVDGNYDIINGGTIGSIGSIRISITRNAPPDVLKNFFNSFYPNNNKYMINVQWDVGIGWDGITNDNQITWLYEFYVAEIDYDYNSMSLTLYTKDFYNIELPRYEVQNKNDKLNYYFEDVEDSVIGLPLPLLYGDFTITSFEYKKVRLAYTICTNRTLGTYLYATHKCQKTIYNNYANNLTNYTNLAGSLTKYALFKYISSAQTYLEIFLNYNSDDYSGNIINNTNALSCFNLLYYIKDHKIFGNIALSDFITYAKSDIQIPNKFNKLNGNIATIERYKTLAVKLNVELGDSDTGLLSIEPSNLKLTVDYQSYNGNEVKLRLQYYNENRNLFSNYSEYVTTATGNVFSTVSFDFGDNITAKDNGNLPYKLDEVIGYDYILYNNSVTDTKINIRRVNIYILNIIIAKLPTDLKMTIYHPIIYR